MRNSNIPKGREGSRKGDAAELRGLPGLKSDVANAAIKKSPPARLPFSKTEGLIERWRQVALPPTTRIQFEISGTKTDLIA
jgi:hypothetical protein